MKKIAIVTFWSLCLVSINLALAKNTPIPYTPYKEIFKEAPVIPAPSITIRPGRYDISLFGEPYDVFNPPVTHHLLVQTYGNDPSKKIALLLSKNFNSGDLSTGYIYLMIPTANSTRIQLEPIVIENDGKVVNANLTSAQYPTLYITGNYMPGPKLILGSDSHPILKQLGADKLAVKYKGTKQAPKFGIPSQGYFGASDSGSCQIVFGPNNISICNNDFKLVQLNGTNGAIMGLQKSSYNNRRRQSDTSGGIVKFISLLTNYWEDDFLLEFRPLNASSEYMIRTIDSHDLRDWTQRLTDFLNF